MMNSLNMDNLEDNEEFNEAIKYHEKMRNKELEVLEENNKKLREFMEGHGMSYLELVTHNDPYKDSGTISPIRETGMNLEGLVNSLLAHYSASGSSDALSVLSFVQSNLISAVLLANDLIESWRKTKKYQDHISPDVKNEIDKIQSGEKYIPQAFRDAFKEDS